MRFALPFLVACGSAKPAPPPPTTAPPEDAAPVASTRPTRDECTRVGANAFAIAKPGLAQQLGDRLDPFGVNFQTLVRTRCVEDAWTQDAATCWIAAKVPDDVTECTRATLTPTQAQHLASDLADAMKASR